MVHAMSYMNGPDMMTVTDEPLEKQCPFFAKEGLTVSDVKSHISSLKDAAPKTEKTAPTADMPVAKATAAEATVTAPKYPSGISVEKTLEKIKLWGAPSHCFGDPFCCPQRPSVCCVCAASKTM